ncbi:hypothetical protein CNMCM5793_001372 [Aspergillus hiratsukae]|uniref:tRNA-splicing endonuclease subunit Sen2 n=1 Tax=Aspergillus hiratsukae TaxID=1194566 RepID=A0A8H6P1L7_9EURO|nr:hypothetical protein CNMCM5793_001372 [Aspergillus hiratsukae]KAF7157043.1 hypothetical protein CNMCM6106_002032 [Aspergillus hiratsukae]
MASSSTSIPSSPAELAGSPSKSMPHNNARPAHRSRPPKPNYKHIHRFPLPLDVHPLPPLIPHNPLSLISVVLSYLTYFISPPHQEIYAAYFDSATSSVHVTDENAIQALWEMGFFGKGTLSRSQPSWLEREKKRRGLLGGQTNEELTRQRRTERRELKLERARMEKVAIEQRLKAEAAARDSGSTTVDETTATLLADGAPGGTAVTLEKFSLRKAREARMLESQRSKGQENTGPASSSPGQESPSKAVRFSPVVQEKEFASDSAILRLPGRATEAQETSQEESVLYNEEHLQLSNEEAFFLAYGLGVLHVYDHEQKAIIPPTSLLSLFCHNSYYPPRDSSTDLKPDDPFVISYIVYHHFRSLGWVVRSGVKFGVDYLLYNRGPVFSHAEFAVVVIPAYEHPYWSATSDRKSYCATKQARSWWWLHCVNRVQAQVKKSLVVCYVEVPPPRSQDTENYSDIGALLSRYKVREMLIRRWVPNRMRD